MNLCLNYLLIHPESNGRQIDQRHLNGYKTHIKKLYRHISTAASYILVLSIIPPH
jgi:hypothetical protein